MPTAIVNGISINYRRTGQGPEVVMIHGLAANLAFWHFAIVSNLSRDFCVTAYDLKGHGRSDISVTGYSTKHMAEDLHKLLDILSVEQVHLVGHSYGGAIALQFALRYPDRAASLTLADTCVQTLQPTRQLREWPYWSLWKSHLRAVGAPIPDDQRDLNFTLLEEWAKPRSAASRRGSGAPDWFVPFDLWGPNRRGSQKWLQLIETTTAGEDFLQVAGLTREKIGRVRQPTLAIFGEYSHCLNSLCQLQNILVNCKAVIVPGVGHFHPLTSPQVFMGHLRTFLQERIQ
jgi:pimeloyl-ACP methyl ester carboxylesterase